MGQYGGQKFRRPIPFQLRRLVSLQTISGRMSPAKGIPAELHEQIPHVCNLILRATHDPRRLGEFFAPRIHLRHPVFHQQAPQLVRPPRIPSGEHLANLQHMLFVSDHAIGRTQDLFQAWMDISHRLLAARPPGELFLAQAVGRARTNDRDNSDQLVDGPYSGHPGQRCHRRALDMMRSARLAFGNHPPDLRIIPCPGLRRINPLLPQRRACITKHGKPALRENIEFDQPHRLDRFHLELRGQPPARAGEQRCQFPDRLPGNDHAAGMHLGMAGKPVEPRRQL